MKKVSLMGILVVILSCLLITFVPLASGAEVSKDGYNNVSDKETEMGINVPDFGTIDREDNSTTVVVKPAQDAEASIAFTIYFVVLGIGVIAAAGLAVYFFVIKRERTTMLRLCAKVLAVAFVAVTLVGTGVTGVLGGLEDTHKDFYYYGNTDGKKAVAPDNIKGYTESLLNRKIFSTYEFGLEGKYDRVFYSAPHFWNNAEPKYNYTKASLPASKAAYYEYGATTKDADNCNFWYVLPPSDVSEKGEDFHVDAEYRLSMQAKNNYEDGRLYDKLRVVFKAENPKNKKVNVSVFVDTRFGEATAEDVVEDYEDPIKYCVGTYEGKSGEKVELTFNLLSIPARDRQYISRIIFRTTNADIEMSTSGSSYQKNSIYFMEMYSTEKMTMNTTIQGIANVGTDVVMDSEYLGSLGFAMYGAYSASGFYDSADKKWKLWYGCGIPENIASDNVYYIESSNLQMGWSTPKRLVLNDPKGELFPEWQSPGYGGDPGIIKVGDTYYMYFTGLSNYIPHPPGKIYLATSKNGVDFTVYGAVVDVPDGGTLGYGAGSPSVIYKDGKYYLYYYTQRESFDYPDEPIGFVLKVGDTPFKFGKSQALSNTFGAADVKWVPSLGLWVATDYTEQGQTGDDFDMVRIGYSKDGLHFDWGNSPWQRPAQDFTAVINHNPGLIGNEYGWGYETMFVNYGVNDLSLRDMDGGMQMDTRQLGWSRITLSVKG